MSIRDDIRFAFQRKDDLVTKLIIINVFVYIVMVLLFFVTTIVQIPTVYQLVIKNLAFFDEPYIFMYRPWSFVSYAFLHSLGPFHILGNMLFLFYFGKLIQEYLGKNKVFSLYFLGAIAGSLLVFLANTFIPYFIQRNFPVPMVGASAAVLCIGAAAATLLPDYRFNLMFIGPIKIVWIVLFYGLISILGTVSNNNIGGNLAHLGGLGMGYLFIKALQKGTDLGKWIIAIKEFIQGIFTKKPKMKTSYKSTNFNKNTSNSSSGSTSQDEIDRILDKISKSGYDSLTKEEKQKLFNASQK